MYESLQQLSKSVRNKCISQFNQWIQSNKWSTLSFSVCLFFYNLNSHAFTFSRFCLCKLIYSSLYKTIPSPKSSYDRNNEKIWLNNLRVLHKLRVQEKARSHYAYFFLIRHCRPCKETQGGGLLIMPINKQRCTLHISREMNEWNDA